MEILRPRLCPFSVNPSAKNLSHILAVILYVFKSQKCLPTRNSEPKPSETTAPVVEWLAVAWRVQRGRNQEGFSPDPWDRALPSPLSLPSSSCSCQWQNKDNGFLVWHRAHLRLAGILQWDQDKRHGHLALTFHFWYAHLNHWRKIKTTFSPHQPLQSASPNPLAQLEDKRWLQVIRETEILLGLTFTSLTSDFQMSLKRCRKTTFGVCKHWGFSEEKGPINCSWLCLLQIYQTGIPGSTCHRQLAPSVLTVHSWNSSV